MTDDPLPPMPTRFLKVQLAYDELIRRVQDIICGTNLTPQMALILAFVGDQVMTRTDIERYGYNIGTSARHSLEQLMDDNLIEWVPGPDHRRRPIKLTTVGRRMAASIRINLIRTEPAKADAAEVAA